MPLLVLINGAPGTGKSSLARRWAEDHPLAIALDVDVLRSMIGGWRAQPAEAGILARRSALAVIEVGIGAGHDVLVPQLAARPGFVADLAAQAALLQVPFVHVVLTASTPTCVRRVQARGEDVQCADGSDDLETSVVRYAAAISALVSATTVVVDNDRDDDGASALRELGAALAAHE